MDKHIYLVGFMGSGKSPIGPVLATRMDRPFYDLDDLIEEEQERTISEIFESQGEEYFRNLESDTLVQNPSSEPCVIALGGGTAYISNILLIGADVQMAASGNAAVVITTLADTDTTIKIYALGVL